MELRDYLRILRAHWFGVLLITALTIGAAAAYTFTRVPVYAADANGFVAIGGNIKALIAQRGLWVVRIACLLGYLHSSLRSRQRAAPCPDSLMVVSTWRSPLHRRSIAERCW